MNCMISTDNAIRLVFLDSETVLSYTLAEGTIRTFSLQTNFTILPAILIIRIDRLIRIFVEIVTNPDPPEGEPITMEGRVCINRSAATF